MKHIVKRSLALLTVLMMIVSLLSGLTLTAAAASVDYQTGNASSTYDGIILNWGERGELATFLSPNAENFYEIYGVTYDELSALDGSADTAAVHESPLYLALHELMAGAHESYTSYDACRDFYQFTDIENNGEMSGNISDFYTGEALGLAWDGNTMSREHTWPKSMGIESLSKAPNDIMMLRPVARETNSSRGNKGYGESTNTSYVYPNAYNGGTYDIRGDVARSVLYMFVRWGVETMDNHDYSVILDYMWNTVTDAEGDALGPVIQSLELLLRWMAEDPVDTWEMGRNDSVESITGTRNVFVDYPELAFDLFEAEAPEMDTPSGGSVAVGYTITAVSANEAQGTVSVSGANVIAEPADGYQVAGYEVTGGEAAVVQHGDVFTVTAEADCTVTVSFKEKNVVSAVFIENGTVQSVKTVPAGYSIFLPDKVSDAPSGCTFLGWITETLADTAEKPATVYAAGNAYSVNSAVTFYALYSYLDENDTSGGETTYRLIQSADQLAEGSSVVIAAADSNVALSTTQNSNNRGQATISKSDDKATISFEDDAGVAVLTLQAGIAVENLSTPEEILTAAYALESGASLQKQYALTGVITSVDEVYNAQYSNVTVTMQVGNFADMPITCYRMTGTGADVIAVGDTITVYGSITNFNGKIEFAEGCTLRSYIPAGSGGEAAVISYKQVTNSADILDGGEFIAAIVYNGEHLAVSDSFASKTGTKIVTVTDGMIEDSADLPVLTFAAYGAGVSIQANGKYLAYGTSGTNLKVQTSAYAWEIGANDDGVTFRINATTGSERALAYQDGQGFKSYATSNSTEARYAFDFYLFEKITQTVLTATVAEVSEETSVETAAAEPTKTYAFYDAANSGYLYAASSGSNFLRTQTTLDLNGSFVITFSEDGSCKLIAQGANSVNNLQYNSSNSIFSCYSGTQKAVALYVGVTGGTTHYFTSGSTCAHAYESVVTAPTCTEQGYTAQTCSACGYVSAVADFVDAAGHSYGDWVVDLAASFTARGEQHRTCSVCEKTQTQKLSVLPSPIDSWAPVLGDGIGVVFRVSLTDTEAANATMSITVNEEITEINFAEETKGEDGFYTVALDLAAAQMNDAIKVESTVGERSVSKEYTVRQYAEYVLAGSYNAPTKALVTEMLHYGAAAQTLFSYNTGNLANAGYEDTVTNLIPGLSNRYYAQLSGSVDGISYYASSMVYKSKNAVRYYFNVTGDIKTYTFKVGETVYTPVWKDSMYYVEVDQIDPADLDESITLTVSDANGSTLNVTYGPMNYIVRQYHKTENVNLKALLQQLYDYYKAAESYVAANAA